MWLTKARHLVSMLIDAGLIVLGTWLARALRAHWPWGVTLYPDQVVPALLFPIIALTWIVALTMACAYEKRDNVDLRATLQPIAFGSLIASIALSVQFYWLQLDISRWFFLLLLASNLTLLIGRRLVERHPKSWRRNLIGYPSKSSSPIQEERVKSLPSKDSPTAYITAGIMLVALVAVVSRLILQVNHTALWLDEFYTLQRLDIPIRALWTQLLSEGDAQLPAYFIFSKPWYHLATEAALGINWAARLGTIVMTFLLLLTIIAIVLRSESPLLGSLLFLSALALLLYDEHYLTHTLEARVYGPLTIAFTSAVICLGIGSTTGALLTGSIVAFLHPSGLLVAGPLLVAIGLSECWLHLRSRSSRDKHRQRRFALGLAVSFGLASLAVVSTLWLTVRKFAFNSAHGHGFSEAEGTLGGLAQYIDVSPIMIALATLLLALLLIVRHDLRLIRVYLPLLTIVLSVLIFRLIANYIPFARAYPRYIYWINVGVRLVVLIAAARLLMHIQHRWGSTPLQVQRFFLLPLILFSVWVTSGWLKAPVRIPSGWGLDTAARFISTYASNSAGIVSTHWGRLTLPSRYGTGLSCSGTAVTAYLDRRARSRFICVENPNIEIADFSELWHVQEPIVPTGQRGVYSGPLPLLATLDFGRTKIDVYTDGPMEGRELDVLPQMTVPDEPTGTLLVQLAMPDGRDVSQLPRRYVLLGQEGASAGMGSEGFALYRVDHESWRASDIAQAVVVSHNGSGALYNVPGRFEQYLHGSAIPTRCNQEWRLTVGISWQPSPEGYNIAVARGDISMNSWRALSFDRDTLGDPTELSLPVGSLSSDFKIVHAIFYDDYYLDLGQRQLTYGMIRFLQDCRGIIDW